MNTIRQYNILKQKWIPTKKQIEFIKEYFGKKFISAELNKENRNYITVIVKI